MHFSEYLRSCRENNKLTQDELVHDLYEHNIEHFKGLDTNALSKWERGLTKPKTARQISIIKYFQNKTNSALPCWDHYSTEETEDLICKAGMHNMIGERKQLIGNFPSELMDVDDMKVYALRSFERMDALIESYMLLQHSYVNEFARLDREQLKAWSLHSSNLFLACEYKESFLGLFFTLRVKPEVFEKIVNFEMKKSEITEKDFASFDEMGSILMIGFFALNDKAATMLFIRYYASLISNQKNIAEIGGVTSNDEAKQIITNMNLHYHKHKVTDDNVKISSYRQTLAHVLASEYVVKMLLSPQSCPEE